MSYDPYEAEQDAAYDDFVNGIIEQYTPEISAEAIGEFIKDRYQSFYRANPLVAETALKVLDDARRLAAKAEPEASLVFAVTAIELGLKRAILEPIVNGLVHSAPAAALVTELTLGHQSVDRFRDLLFSILREEVNIDMTTYKRPGSSSNVWQEIGEIQNRRNGVVHRGERTSTEQAGQAIDVATWILDQLFPAVVRAQGLHLHDGVRICNERHPSLFKP